METFSNKIQELVLTGQNIQGYGEYFPWEGRVAALLSAAISDQAAEVFKAIGASSFSQTITWHSDLQRQIGHLEGLALRIEANGIEATKGVRDVPNAPQSNARASNRVFVVHGHDHGAKEMIARFVERIGLEPVVLHEKANEGRTIIEKFEAFADVGFAVVLLTPDDLGSLAASPEKSAPRARQNVVLELGYFTGKLGRSKVCALCKHGVEIPSDLHGVLYLPIDEAGAWRTKLAQELVQAGMKINLQALITG